MRYAALTAATMLATALALALAPGSAPAAVTFSGTLVTPKTIDTRTTEILYYLQMHTDGEKEERFSVRFDPPPFATRGGFFEGESIDGPRAVALQGPGIVTFPVSEPRFTTPCSARDSFFHGYTTGRAAVDVLLPPNSNTVLAVRYRTGRRPPWIDGDYRLTFRVQPQLVGDHDPSSPFAQGATVPRTKVIRTEGPAVKGRTGAHILLATSPWAPRGDTRAPRRIGRRTKVRISGRVLPSIRGKKVVVQYARPGGPLRTLQTVRTDSRGAFRARPWAPPGRGTYEIWARYPRQSGPLTSDRTSCPFRYRVG